MVILRALCICHSLSCPFTPHHWIMLCGGPRILLFKWIETIAGVHDRWGTMSITSRYRCVWRTHRHPCNRIAAVLPKGLTVNKGRLCKNLVLYVHMRSVVHIHSKNSIQGSYYRLINEQEGHLISVGTKVSILEDNEYELVVVCPQGERFPLAGDKPPKPSVVCWIQRDSDPKPISKYLLPAFGKTEGGWPLWHTIIKPLL